MPEANVSAAQAGARELAKTFTGEGLTQFTPDGRVVPRLAESWQWENNGLRLRITLRPNVKFHDGQPFKAPLAAKLLQDAISKASNRRSYPSFADVSAIDSVEDSQLAIELVRPSALILEDLEVLLQAGESVGTGPYRLLRADSSELVLERSPNYYLGTPRINRVIIKPFETLRTTWSSLLRGDVDMVTDVPPDAIEFITNSNIQVVSYPRRYQYVIAFNSQRRPFDSSPVRRALNAAIDRDAIVKKVLRGHGLASTGPLWPQNWAYDSSVQPYKFDRGMAMALLDTAGYRIGSAPASATGSPSARIRFTCLIPSNFEFLERLALEVQRQLYEIGVDVNFESLPFDTYNARIGSGNFEATLIDMISGPTLARPFIFWRSARTFKGLNVFGYENAEAERLFEILRTTTNEAAIRSAARQLERTFVDDPPGLFLAWNERTRGISRELNVYQEPGRDPLLTLWRWTAANEVRTASVQ